MILLVFIAIFVVAGFVNFLDELIEEIHVENSYTELRQENYFYKEKIQQIINNEITREELIQELNYKRY